MPGVLGRATARAVTRAARFDRAVVRRLARDMRRHKPTDADWLDLVAAALLSPQWWARWVRYHAAPGVTVIPTPPRERGN